MPKIKQPSIQNPTKRLAFFLEHPEYPNAEYWTKRLREELSWKKFGFTKRVAEDSELLSGILIPRDITKRREEQDPVKEDKKNLIHKIINKFKK